MSPTHHLPDELLLEYATGAATEAVALFVASHATLCPSCRSRIQAMEQVGGELLEEAAPASLSAGATERVMAALDDDVSHERPALPYDGVIPHPLLEYVGPAAALDWKWVGPGIRRVVLPLKQGSMSVRLFELGAGVNIPVHQHSATERTLVLTGGFTDEFGHFGRGDVSVLESGFDHTLVVDDGGPCIAFVVNDGPLEPKTLRGHLYQLFIQA